MRTTTRHHPLLLGSIALLCAGVVLASGHVTRCDASVPPLRRVIRIEADPNNLPFTNRRREGFENRIADLLARDLHARIRYVWRAQRRGFFREALKDGNADLVLGVPAGFERALTTHPYYRSSYVFVTRHDRGISLASLDDPRLRDLRVGVQLIGDDGMNTPPAHALARRGIVDHVVGYTVYGNYRSPNPPSRIIDAVARGDIDVALAWGPLAGYGARHHAAALDITPILPAEDAGLPLTFAIAMGVRKDDAGLRAAIDSVLVRRHAEIERILDSYGVPRVATPEARAAR
jgi:mxaJ protein